MAWIAPRKSRRRILTIIRGLWITRACGNYSKTPITERGRHERSAANYISGFLPSARLADRSRDAYQSNAAAHPAVETLARGAGVAGGSAGRRRAARYPRAGARRDRHRDRRRSAPRELF